MAKTSTEPTRHALSGATMGTRWAALFYTAPGFDPEPLRAAMQDGVAEVDAQMSTWTALSDLMRFNRAPAGAWVALPDRLLQVLAAGLEIGRLSGGAFDIGMGDVVTAWGFGADPADPARIRAALATPRRPAQELLELDPVNRRARKHAPLALDLSGIAKGYGVDRLAETARDFGLDAALVSIDGELRAHGLQPDGQPWSVAVERPDREIRAPHAIVALENAAIATSGDYRHWVDVGGTMLGHTMDPRRGGPLPASPASVTVVAESCMAADAFATALMVLGEDEGRALADRLGLDALFLLRDGADLREVGVGALFG
jgi:FAD:protein FMN transferase